MEVWKFKVEGIKCGGCQSTVTEALSAIAGLEVKEVNLDGTVRISGESLNKKQIKTRLKEVGYPVRSKLLGL